MPQVRMFNPAGREVFPPKPVNVDNDPDRSRLRIVIVPPGNFLAKEGVEGAEGTAAAPTIVGGVIPIAADDALHVPAFYDSSAFPEPEVPEVEEPPTVASRLGDNDGVGDATGAGGLAGVPHIMTEAERQALEAEYDRLVAARHERLKGVNVIPFEQPEVIKNDPMPLVHTPQWKRPKRTKDEIIAELIEAMDDEPDSPDALDEDE